MSAFTIKPVGFAGKKVYSLISDGTAEFNTAKKESIDFYSYVSSSEQFNKFQAVHWMPSTAAIKKRLTLVLRNAILSDEWYRKNPAWLSVPAWVYRTVVSYKWIHCT